MMLWVLLAATALVLIYLVPRLRARKRFNREIWAAEAEAEMLGRMASIFSSAPSPARDSGPSTKDVEDAIRISNHRDRVDMEAQRLFQRLRFEGPLSASERARHVTAWESFKTANPTPHVASAHPSITKIRGQIQKHLEYGDKMASGGFDDEWATQDRESAAKSKRESAEKAVKAAATKAAEQKRIDDVKRRSTAESSLADDDLQDRIRRHQEAQKAREAERGTPNPWTE